MYNFILSNRENDFLKNNYNNVYDFKNINFSILTDLPVFKKNNLTTIKEKKQFLNIKTEFNSLFDYKKDYLTIKSFNINFSLDIFSDVFFVNNIFYVINNLNEKKVDLVFKNFTSQELIEQYKKILDEIFKIRDLKDFNFDIRSIQDLEIKNNTYKIIDVLKKKIKDDENEPKKKIFDLYLKDYKNVPESGHNIFNLIFFLRKFPLFNKLIEKYFKENESEYFDLLFLIENVINIEENISEEKEEYSIEDVIENYDNNTLFDTYLDFYLLNNKIINIKFLLDDNLDSEHTFFLNSYYIPYNIKLIKEQKLNFDIGKILSVYKNLINQKTSLKNLYSVVFSFYLNANPFPSINKYLESINAQEEIYKEQINILINSFVFYLFFVFEYYNLDQYKNLNDLEEIFNNNFDNISWEEIPSLDYKQKLNNFLYHIYTAYVIFKDEGFYSFYKKIMFNLKHFFYIFKYFKNNNDKLFPLFSFLLFSEERIKVIKKYNSKENNILIFLENLYDKYYQPELKYILS